VNRVFETTLQNAAMEVEYARDALTDLKSESETRKLWKAWAALLTHYVKATGAMRHATNGGSSKRWSDNLIFVQKSDPFLSYGFHARNSEGHALDAKREVAPKSASIPGAIKVEGTVKNLKFLGNSLIGPDGRKTPIPDFTGNIVDGKVFGDSGERSWFVETDHFVRLNIIHDNRSGKSFPLPNVGSPKERQAIEIADYIVIWLEEKLADALDMAESEKERKKRS